MTTSADVNRPATTTAQPAVVVRQVLATIARIGFGLVLLAHGWQKLFTFGHDGVRANFESMSAPVPGFSAWFAALVEFVAGIAFIVGAALPLFAVLVVIDMLGAYLVAHADFGLLQQPGGYETVLLIAVGAVLAAAVDYGRLGVDGYIGRGLARRRAAAQDR